MKHVLFVAHDFPPTCNIGGSLRSEKFAHYLPDFGWEPTIVTLDEQTGLAEQYPQVHRLPSPTPWTKPYECRPIGWALALPRLLRKLMTQRHFDALYISCPPFPPALPAVSCANRHGIPALVDLRDAWSLDPYVEGSLAKKVVHHLCYPWLEKKTLEATRLLVVNTESAMSAYVRRYPSMADRIQVLPNGFDDADFAETSVPTLSTGPFTLLYTGRFGIGARSPELLLQALQRARQSGADIRFQIVGDDSVAVRNAITNLELQAAVTLCGQIPHTEATAMLRSAHALVLYQQPSRSAVTAVAGKTHEYLRTGRPILAVAPEGDNLALVRNFAPESHCISSYDVEEIARAMQALAEMHARGDLSARLGPSPEYLHHFNRRALTGKLADMLSDIARAS